MQRLIRALITFAAAAFVSSAFAAPEKTCLVLGGGGARGAAHIGVLRVLEREHVAIDCIAGTSMGAIVGGFYAAGYNVDQIEQILRSIDWKDMFSDDPPRRELPMRRKDDELRFLGGIELGLRNGRIALPRGVIQGQKLQLLLRRLLLATAQVERFDDLPIPFRAVATDIASGQAVVYADGDLATAIRTSMSVPGAFAPIRYRGRLMVDGGISDNLPIDVARGMGATRVIVVDVSEPLTSEDKLTSPFAIANQMLTALMKRATDEQLATLSARDVLITPSLNDVASADFDRTTEIIPLGIAGAEENIDRLRDFSVDDARYADFERRHRTLAFDTPLIAFLDVLKTRSRTATYVENRLSDLVGKPLDVERVERDIGTAFGYGSYERITYGVEKRDGETGLRIEPVDKGWGPSFLRFGLALSDDFAGRNSYQLTGELNFTGLNRYGGESRNRIEIGRVTGAHAEFYQPFGNQGQYYVAPYLEYRAFNLPLTAGPRTPDFAEVRRGRAEAALEAGYTPTNAWRLSAAIERGRDDFALRVGDPTLFSDFSQNFAGLKFRVTEDDLDSSAFPRRGNRFDLSEELFIKALGSPESARTTRLSYDRAIGGERNTLLLGIRGSSASGGPDVLQTFDTLGGLGNLSGYTENQLLGPQVAFGRAIYYHRLGDGGLFTTPAYIGGSIEAGNVWQTRSEAKLSSLIYAGSVFLGIETFIGPIFIGYGRADSGNSSFYLNFGSLIRPNP